MTTTKVIVDRHTASIDPHTSLFEAAEGLGVRVPTSCRKQGKCRECLVEIDEGAELLSAPSPEEAHLREGFRLSCRTRVEREGTVVCHTLRRGAMRVEESAHGLPTRETIAEATMTRRGADLLRAGHKVGVAPDRLLGVAVDLGTTTVVMRLHDLESGDLLATQSFENPQRYGGSDIMARIQYDLDHPGRLLQRTLLGYLRHTIEALPAEPEQIVDFVVAGNTTMRDLFFGLDVSSVGQKPYRSLTEHEFRDGKRSTTSLRVSARKLGLPLHPAAEVCGLPLVSSHVGADAAAALLATDLGSSRELHVLMDLGTNTELILGNRERLLAASCPAGPAFEGGAITCGMPALEGAIERVRWNGKQLSKQVIGGGSPVGICGSGLIDALGELRRTESMNAQGRLEDECNPFVLDREEGVVLTEADINELAQAKGANVAGLRILLDRFGKPAEAIERFYLAGGFARHLDLDAARQIGLIPDLPDDRFVQVGNASLEGASLALTSTRHREQLEQRVRTIEHVELETHPQFFDFFVEGCQFEPVTTR